VDKSIRQFCERQYNKCIDVGDVEGAKNAKSALDQYIEDSGETRWKSLGFKDSVNESTLNKVKPSLLAKSSEAANSSTLGSASPKVIGKGVKMSWPVSIPLLAAGGIWAGAKVWNFTSDTYEAGKQKVEQVSQTVDKAGQLLDKVGGGINNGLDKANEVLEGFDGKKTEAPKTDKPADGKISPDLFKSSEEPKKEIDKPADGKISPDLFKKSTGMVEPRNQGYTDMEIAGSAKPTAIVDARLTNASKPIELS
jgi:hypothetical protein